LGGWRNPALEASYQRYVFEHTFWCDATWGLLDTVFLVAGGMLKGLGQQVVAMGWGDALAARQQEVLLVVGQMLPWLALLAVRPWLAQGRRWVGP
jgi:hypothetical protein